MASVTGNFLDGFETYDVGASSDALLLSGVYAELISGGSSESVGTPAWGPRSGLQSLHVAATTFAGGAGVRKALDDSYDELMLSVAFSCSRLPQSNGYTGIVTFRDAANDPSWTLGITTTGQLVVIAGDVNGAVLATSAGPVIRAQTWQWIEIYTHFADGDCIIYVDDEDTAIINTTALAFLETTCAQFVLGRLRGGAGGGAAPDCYFDDLWARKLEVADTPDFKGDIAVATLYPNADTTTAGWEAYPRKKLGTGILDTRANNNSGVTIAQSTGFDLGSGDYTLEGFVRFDVLPTGAEAHAIFGKWVETGNLRSYQLIMCGPSLNDGQLVFRISTDGLAGSVQNLLTWPWTPQADVWYFLTVERVAGETTLYIDGIAQGLTVPDVNTYATVSAAFAIACEISSGTSPKANSRINGFSDELRITKGVYRYDGDFTPPTEPFPTNTTDDPLFADVELLAQWDNGIVDSSLNGRALTARNGAVQNTPDDGAFAYQTINNVPPRDDTFIEAQLTRASSVLAFAADPTNTQTVVLGTETYTFKTVLAVAYDVLIGATAEDSIENLVAAINNDAGEGTLYGTGTLPNDDAFAEKRPLAVLEAFAILAGTAGNAIVTTTTVTSAAWSGATLAGGADIPGPSQFELQRLPYDVTEVFAVGIFTRGYKTSAGTVKMTTAFVGPQGGETLGDEVSLSTNPTFHQDVFIEDPDGGPLSPSTIISAKVKVNRTE